MNPDWIKGIFWGLWACLLACILPSAHAQADPFQTLESCRLNAYTERDDLIIGAVVYNWETGAGCTQNLNSTFPVASVGKIFVLEALYLAVAEGRLRFDQELVFSDKYWMDGRDDCLNDAALGRSFTLGYLGNIMISCSDNAATWMLMDLLGWENVRLHIQNLGIEGIGEVLPYAFVDQLKLASLDSAWENVPTALASRFYRGRNSEGLSPRYFSRPPRYSGAEIRRANAAYLENYNYNTATPHALALYLQGLRQQLLSGNETQRTVSRWMFNTLLLTQRGFSTQYFPPSVYVGNKNGYDLGYRAELNITVRDFQSVLPETLAFVVVRHREIDIEDLRPYTFRNVPTTDLLLAVSPKLQNLLYPDYDASLIPIPIQDERVRRVVVNMNQNLYPCYQTYLGYDYLDGLQQCWAAFSSIDRVQRDDLLGVGIIFRNLNFQDARVSLLFTLPDGTPRSYQMQDFFKNGLALAWFEDVSINGVWRIDLYFNLQAIYTQQFYVDLQQ